MGRAEARRAQQQRGARRAPRGRGRGKGRGGKPTGIRRFFTWKKVLGTFFGAVLLGMAALIGLYFYVELPDPNADARAQNNVYKLSDGTVMARVGAMNRQIVSIDKVPGDVQTAFIAIENKSFYTDQGVDLKGIGRGVFNTVTGRGKAGGSTITQQYVKNFYLTQDQTATRKLRELIISLKVDQELSKPEILAGYLNTNFYGRNAYGIQAAAQAYYGVDADKLTLEQGAYLAAVLQAPSQYDWATAGPNGKKLVMIRFNGVLDNMVEMGKLDPAKRQGMKFQEPIKPKVAAGSEGQKGYLIQAADEEVKRQTGMTDGQLKAGGWEITLSIDPKKQAALEKAVQDELESKLDRKGRTVDAAVQAGATSVDPKTGAIVAMYGGTGQGEQWASNALRKDFQPGSTFKPVVLAAALERKSVTQDERPITPNTLYDGTSKRPVVGSDTPFNPQNQDDRDYGDPMMTVQSATNSSVNSVYAQMIVDVGPKNAKTTALQLGMKDRDGWPEDRPAMSLGTMSADTVEMAGVYATFDNHGKKVTPSIVKSAKHAGREYKAVRAVGDQAISRKTADTVTKVLTGVVEDGSGKAVRSSAYEAAGKTGTTERNVAAWFTGFTPELVTVVAMFGDDPVTHKQTSLTGTAGGGRAGGSSFPAAIWKEYTLAALQGGNTGSFDLEEADMGKVQSPSTSSSPSSSPSGTPSSSKSPSGTPSSSKSPSGTPSSSKSPSGTPSSSKSPSSTPSPSKSSSSKPSSPPNREPER
ncbi:transglycosylase domain-containing protein [Streptomyces sp. AP-93]|uniref:transglycosylase domain-containing protein n=1 Tax=Streptomyces sp. AP-93 TaxID=2929048 RepID=UPI001FAF8C64|nr:transglycosylase domain-containing protein [Streptomyces sp. AP-93]MCJ0871238.1 penicillin-binding protein [Streptomyces sp. AP-93]